MADSHKNEQANAGKNGYIFADQPDQAQDAAQGTATPLKTDVSSYVPPARDIEADRELLKKDGQADKFPARLAQVRGMQTDALDPFLLNFLNEYEVVQESFDADGNLQGMIARLPLSNFPDGQDINGLEVTKEGVSVIGMTDEQRLSDAGLEAQLEAALVAKAAAPGGVNAFHQNPEILYSMIKSAEVAGLEIKNKNAANQWAADHPERAAEIENGLQQAWQRVQGKHELGDYKEIMELEDKVEQVENLEVEQDDYVTLLKNTGMTEDQLDPSLHNDQERLAILAVHGQSFIGDGGPHPVTATPLIPVADLDPDYVRQAKELLEEKGVADPDGSLAQGIGALNQTVEAMMVADVMQGHDPLEPHQTAPAVAAPEDTPPVAPAEDLPPAAPAAVAPKVLSA